MSRHEQCIFFHKLQPSLLNRFLNLKQNNCHDECSCPIPLSHCPKVSLKCKDNDGTCSYENGRDSRCRKQFGAIASFSPFIDKFCGEQRQYDVSSYGNRFDALHSGVRLVTTLSMRYIVNHHQHSLTISLIFNLLSRIAELRQLLLLVVTSLHGPNSKSTGSVILVHTQ